MIFSFDSKIIGNAPIMCQIGITERDIIAGHTRSVYQNYFRLGCFLAPQLGPLVAQTGVRGPGHLTRAVNTYNCFIILLLTLLMW